VIKAIAIAKRNFPNIRLHVVGTHWDSIHPDFKSLIIKEGVEANICFHGRVSQCELSRYYKSADFCVFASLLETFGIVILEAMASGAPIIASDIEPFREILTEGTTGLFFRHSNSIDLSKAILRLASDTNLRKLLSKNSLEAVKNYDWANIALKYIELYKSLSK